MSLLHYARHGTIKVKCMCFLLPSQQHDMAMTSTSFILSLQGDINVTLIKLSIAPRKSMVSCSCRQLTHLQKLSQALVPHASGSLSVIQL